MSGVNLSVCVPVHDPRGEHLVFLTELLTSLLQQDLIPVEVVLSSNHELPYRKTLVDDFGGFLNLRILTSSAQNAASNLNFAISQCEGDLVRVLFQDDFLPTPESLSASALALASSGLSWAVCGFDHLDQSRNRVFRPLIPKFTKRLAKGVNRVGPPSVVTLRKSAQVQADETLVFMFDCEWYLRMAITNGPPLVVARLGCRVRIHPLQATHWAKAHFAEEKLALKKSLKELAGLKVRPSTAKT